MRPHIEKRVIDIARYVAERKVTVRDAAKRFGISKSTVHKDLRDRLPKLDKQLYKEVDEVLSVNLAERHIRGGEATRQRWEGRRTG